MLLNIDFKQKSFHLQYGSFSQPIPTLRSKSITQPTQSITSAFAALPIPAVTELSKNSLMLPREAVTCASRSAAHWFRALAERQALAGAALACRPSARPRFPYNYKRSRRRRMWPSVKFLEPLTRRLGAPRPAVAEKAQSPRRATFAFGQPCRRACRVGVAFRCTRSPEFRAGSSGGPSGRPAAASRNSCSPRNSRSADTSAEERCWLRAGFLREVVVLVGFVIAYETVGWIGFEVVWDGRDIWMFFHAHQEIPLYNVCN